MCGLSQRLLPDTGTALEELAAADLVTPSIQPTVTLMLCSRHPTVTNMELSFTVELLFLNSLEVEIGLARDVESALNLLLPLIFQDKMGLILWS